MSTTEEFYRSIPLFYLIKKYLDFISECGRSYPGTTKGGKVLRLFVANLSKTCLTGICCSFTRSRVDIPVNSEKIHEVRQSCMCKLVWFCYCNSFTFLCWLE